MTRTVTCDESGFSLAELIVVVAVIGILSAFAVPMMLSYWQTSTLLAGAREVATVLNSARELAIRENNEVCVTADGVRLQYRLKSAGPPATPACNNVTPWTGPVTDGVGNISLVNRVTVNAPAGAEVIFNYLGAATRKGCYTVLSSTNTLRVSVAQNGRVSVLSVGQNCP